ncbi:MAG: DSD1 family PLP-dependent enzyme [Ideonella sp.]
MTAAPAASVGSDSASIRSPALVIDLDAMERNLTTMARFARERGVKLRPHAKMHKSAQIAALQIDAGAVGVCVQKLSEAQALADGGVGDIFISNEIIDAAKLAEVAALAARIRLAICVDSPLGISRLERAIRQAGSRIDVFVEIDVGQGRCGASAEQAAALVQQIKRSEAAASGLRFAGLQAYHGGAQHLRDPGKRRGAIDIALHRVRHVLADLQASGIACPLVTGAGTGSFVNEVASGVYGELQAGSYLFMDADYAANQADPAAPVFEHALFVKSQVISRHPERAVVDAGHKSHAIDSGLPLVHGRKLSFANGGDEHGVLSSAGDALPELGEIVWLIPGHCDPSVNLHDHFVVLRGGLANGMVEAIWPVDARGCIR